MYQAMAMPWRRGLAALLASGCVWASVALAACAAEPPADNGAVVVMYHRFGESEFSSTNIRIDQFEAHIELLRSGRYNVLPLAEITAALAQRRLLPDRSVAITIDDAYLTVYTQAWPRLRKAGLPFTVFVATAPLDGGFPDYMNWTQLREMLAAGGVTIGAHSVTHGRMVEQSTAEIRQDISRSSARFRDELGLVPTLFAYPFGEFGLAVRDVVAESGFAAAFGQHSGAISRVDDRYALPRFPLNETYGDLNRFRTVVNALPIPVADVTPLDPLLSSENNPPSYGFTVAAGIENLDSMACYAAGRTLDVERLGSRRMEVRLATAFAPGRNRVNCTLPGPGGRWRWLGRQFYVPRQ